MKQYGIGDKTKNSEPGDMLFAQELLFATMDPRQEA